MAINKISELDKQGKISLLTAIKDGEITPDQISPESVLICNGEDVFTGMMIAATDKKKGTTSRVVFVGPALKAIQKFLDNIKQRRELKEHAESHPEPQQDPDQKNEPIPETDKRNSDWIFTHHDPVTKKKNDEDWIFKLR